MRMTRLALAAAAFFSAAFGLLAQPAHAGEQIDTLPTPFFVFCRTNYDIANTFYLSSTQQVAAGTTRNALQKSFGDFVRAKYKYPPDKSVSCVFAPNGDLQGRTESTRVGTIESLRSQNFNAVEVDWKYAK